MSKKKLLILTTFFIHFIGFGLTVTGTYNNGDIPTNNGNYDATCNGAATPLTISLPAGGPWIVTSVDLEYVMTSPAAGGGFMSEQRSRLFCQNTGLDEGTDFTGTGNTGGTQPYNRTGLTIANNQYAGGTDLIFELQAYRTWAGTAGCNTIVTKIDDGTWIVTVTYVLATSMVYTGLNIEQASTDNVENCVNSAEILRMEVTTTGTLLPLDLTEFNLTTTGTTNLAEVSSINIYYTGNSPDFSNANLFGTATTGGAVVVNGVQTLVDGINYFWVEYVLISPTTLGNVLNGTVTDCTIDGNVELPTSTNLGGGRVIGICNPSPGGIDDEQVWLLSDNGVTGTSPITGWDNQGVNTIVTTLTGGVGTQLNASEPYLNFHDGVKLNGGYNGTLHQTVPARTDIISGDEITMFVVTTGNPDLTLSLHSTSSSNSQWEAFGFRHGGLGTIYSGGGVGNTYNPNFVNGNMNIFGMRGQSDAAGENTSNGFKSPVADVGTFTNSNTSFELAVGYWPGYGNAHSYTEAIVWDKKLTAVEFHIVESYLAMKYGVTLGENGVSMDYNAASNAVVWNAALNTGFANDVFGIARDDNSGLSQLKSHSVNGTSQILFNDILTLVNGVDFANPTVFTDDQSFAICGNNGGTLTNTGAAVDYTTDNNLLMSTIFDRVWKVEETGVVADIALEFNMTNSTIQLGAPNDYDNIRLLVDEDGDFSNGATAYFPTSFDAANNLIYFEHDFTPTNGNDLTQDNGFFFTLAAVESVVANFAMNDTTICVGETLTFSDSSFTSPITWDWTFNGGDVTSANTQGPHDITFSTPGVYDIVLSVTDANSSDDSTLQVIVSGYPTVDAGLSDTICEGEDYTMTAIILEANASPAVWDNGIVDGVVFTPTDSMMYHVSSNINGCESIDSMILELTNTPDISVPLDFSICDGEDTLLNATSSNPNAIISWDNGIVNNQLFTPTITTTYTATSTVLEGTMSCSSTDQVEIIVNIIPDVDAGADDAICEGENYTLTAINPNGGNLVWNNGVIDNVQFTPTDSLQYIVIVELNGCENEDTVIVDVNPNPELTISSAVTICDGESTILTATSADADGIVWNNGIIDGQSFVPLNTLNYTATATITVGTNVCTTVESVQVTVNPNPIVDADVSGDDLVTLCQGDNYTLTAVNPNNSIISWTNGVTDNVSFTPTNSLMYHVTANLNGCISMDSISIDVVTSPIVDAGIDQKICVGDSVMLSATVDQTLSTIAWDINSANNSYVYPQSTQVYTVSATLGNCSSSDDMTVTVVGLPDAGFTYNPNPITVEDTEVQFTQFNTEEGETYTWNLGDNTSSTLESPIHVYPDISGLSYNVQLTVKDSVGCVDSSNVQITVFDVLVYYIPNAFTPDGDTYNETFQPVFTSGFDPYEYHLIIFNRWGETIFESFNDEIGWDGTYNGNRVADGVYVWTVQFGELLSDKKIRDRGTVTILK